MVRSTPMAKARRASKGLSELSRIVQINEEIKRIVRTAFDVNLMALNAIVLAAKTGDAAGGFGVLSYELRRFALDLTQEMDALARLTGETVQCVSAFVQLRRRIAIFEEAEARGEGAVGSLTTILRRGRAEQQHRRDELAAGERLLRSALQDTERLVELGTALAGLAKIEAAHGGALRANLMQVSDAFAEMVERLRSSIELLGRRVKG